MAFFHFRMSANSLSLSRFVNPKYVKKQINIGNKTEVILPKTFINILKNLKWDNKNIGKY